MRTRMALDGLRKFLGDVDARWRPETDLTSLLRGQGFSQEQVETLRRAHLDAFVEASRALIETRLRAHDDGERLYRVLERCNGLDGRTPAPLATVAANLGLSGKRAGQVREETLAYCRRPGMAWSESLGEIAAHLVGEPAARAGVGGDDYETADPAAEGGASSLRISLQAREEIGAMVAAIEGQVGKRLINTLIARVLVGQRAPEIEALVASHHLPHYGALKGMPRRDVGRLLDVLRATGLPTIEPPLPRPMEEPAPPPAPTLADVAVLVTAIRAAAPEPIGVMMVAHILFGSHGPRVDALRERCHPPHDGTLRALGIKRVVELVRAVGAMDGLAGTPLEG